MIRACLKISDKELQNIFEMNILPEKTVHLTVFMHECWNYYKRFLRLSFLNLKIL